MLSKLMENGAVAVVCSHASIPWSDLKYLKSALCLDEGKPFGVRDTRFRLQKGKAAFTGSMGATDDGSKIGELPANMRFCVLVSDSPSQPAKAVLKGRSRDPDRFGIVVDRNHPTLQAGRVLYFYSAGNVLHCYDSNGQQLDSSKFAVGGSAAPPASIPAASDKAQIKSLGAVKPAVAAPAPPAGAEKKTSKRK